MQNPVHESGMMPEIAKGTYCCLFFSATVFCSLSLSFRAFFFLAIFLYVSGYVCAWCDRVCMRRCARDYAHAESSVSADAWFFFCLNFCLVIFGCFTFRSDLLPWSQWTLLLFLARAAADVKTARLRLPNYPRMMTDGWAMPVACVGTGLLAGYYYHRLANPPRATSTPPSNLPHHKPTMSEGSVAYVTGVSPGTMGEGIAEELAALGCSIVAVEHPSRLPLCKESCEMLKRKYATNAIVSIPSYFLLLLPWGQIQPHTADCLTLQWSCRRYRQMQPIKPR